MDELKQEVENLTQQLKAVNDTVPLDVRERDRILAELASKKQQLADDEQWVAEHNRIQEQEQKIESIDEMSLPYDFNDIFANAGANDIIRELLKEQYRKLYDEHNDEIAKLHTDYKDKLRAAEDRERQWKLQNDNLQERIVEVTAACDELANQLNETKSRLNEVESNRKNAGDQLGEANKEIARLNSHIEDLRIQIDRAPAPSVSVVDITPSASLDEMINRAKEETKKRLINPQPVGNLFVEGINPETGKKELIHRSEFEAEPPQVPEVQPVGDTSFRGENPSAEPENGGVPDAQVDEVGPFRQTVEGAAENIGVQVAGETVEQRLAALEKRVDAIERHANLPGVA